MLSRTIMHIYGPINIYSYGLMIALGVVIATYLLLKDQRRIVLTNKDDLLKSLSVGTLVGIAGGRLLYLASNYDKLTHVWQVGALYEGGLSILGAVLAIIIFMPCYLKKLHIPILPFLDLISSYAPLIQSISRLGCFFAGCCFGAPTDASWAITYTNPDTLAPLFCSLHPTQLYSTFALLLIFFFLQWVCKRYTLFPGQLTCLYLMLFSAQRGIIDFWRGDRMFSSSVAYISLHQWIALGLMLLAAGAYYICSYTKRS